MRSVPEVSVYPEKIAEKLTPGGKGYAKSALRIFSSDLEKMPKEARLPSEVRESLGYYGHSIRFGLADGPRPSIIVRIEHPKADNTLRSSLQNVYEHGIRVGLSHLSPLESKKLQGIVGGIVVNSDRPDETEFHFRIDNLSQSQKAYFDAFWHHFKPVLAVIYHAHQRKAG